MKSLLHSVLLTLALVGPALLSARAVAPDVVKSDWNGYARIDFNLAGRSCLLVQPVKPAPGNPWVWRTEFFGVEPQVDLALLAAGWHVAYMNAKDMYGAPPAIALFGAFYAHLVANYDLSPRVVIEGFNRGGLSAFNFAIAHPNRVAALYLDAPVLDIRSWPGRYRDTREWAECLAVYGLTEETVAAFRGNPLDHIDAVARAGVPIIAVCDEADPVVPFGQNTALLEKRYRELGGTMQVIFRSSTDHRPYSLKDPAPIVNFITTQAHF